MTTIATNTFSGPYEAAGQTTFPVTFQSAGSDEIVVTLDGSEVDSSAYIFNRAEDGTGSVVFSLPQTGEVFIYSEPSFQDSAEFERFGAFYPDQLNPVLDRSTRRDQYLKDSVDRSLRVNRGDAIAPLGADRAGKHLAFDVLGNPVPSSGTGADAGLRTDLASPAGASLVGLLDGTALSGVPRRLRFGTRAPVTNLREAREILNGTNGRTPLHQLVVGYAAHPNAGGAGVSGGYGKAQYYVNIMSWDETIPYSMGSALAAAKAAGGGQIYIEPRGKKDLIVTDRSQFRFETLDGNNITIYAPGRNFTIWTTSLSGNIVMRGQNILFYNVVHKTLAGPTSGDFVGDGSKAEVGIVTVSPDTCDKIAFVNCEFWHASDGACDVASSTFNSSMPECNVTFQNCIFGNTDEVQLLGVTGTAAGTRSIDARKLFVTHYNTGWLYCGQRQPKTLGLGFCHMVNCYTVMQPFDRDQPLPVASPGSCDGATVQGGGWLLAEGCLWSSSEGVSYPATNYIANPTSGETGYIRTVGCVAENGCTFAANNGTVPSPAYSLPYTPIPSVGPAREAWIADRYLAMGGRPDAAPPGQFVFTTDTSRRPDGDSVLVQRGVTGRYYRIDERNEYPDAPTDAAGESSLFVTARSYTRYPGYVAGKTSGAALGTGLDLVALDTNYFTTQGNGAPTTAKYMFSTGADPIPDGLHVLLSGSSTNPTTIVNKTTAPVTAVAATDVLTAAGHGLTTGLPVFFTSTGAVPGGLISKQQYFAIVLDANTFKVALSYDNAAAGTAIDLTDAGTGTITGTFGSFNLPNAASLVLDSAARMVEFVYDAANFQWLVAARSRYQVADITDYYTAPVGYGPGAGGAVAQATSKTTAVTLNTLSGQITMNAAALAANTIVSFTLNNTQILPTDQLVIRVKSGNATPFTYRAWSEGNATGSRPIALQNISASSLSEAVVLEYVIVRGSIS